MQVGRSITRVHQHQLLRPGGNRVPSWSTQYTQVGDVAPSYSDELRQPPSRLGRFHLYGLLDWQRGGNVGNLTNAYFDPVGLFLLADSAAEAKRITAAFMHGQAGYVESASFLKLREITLSY